MGGCFASRSRTRKMAGLRPSTRKVVLQPLWSLPTLLRGLVHGRVDRLPRARRSAPQRGFCDQGGRSDLLAMAELRRMDMVYARMADSVLWSNGRWFMRFSAREGTS